jgi:hypothetical protein
VKLEERHGQWYAQHGSFGKGTEISPTWNSTVLAVREARRYVEELMMLNLTVPASRVAAPDASGF